MVFKRLFDVTFTLCLFPVALPIVVLSAITIALHDGGNPFYRQMRLGRNGRVFSILKLRTMVRDADTRLMEHLRNNPDAAAEWQASQKLRHDPRVTVVGCFLRKTSLDELPQLWNVLKGDMSLVGPRPMMVTQRHFYSGDAYYKLRPGITGNWQVSARNESEFASRANFDNAYHDDLSLVTDLQILYRTIGVVFRATGR
jgi:lipopolysaccharide/colanic/teichoic acid biosynthesis glycosyltransferase